MVGRRRDPDAGWAAVDAYIGERLFGTDAGLAAAPAANAAAGLPTSPSTVAFLDNALRLLRPGTTTVVDNVVREGGVLGADSTDPRVAGTRALFDAVAAEPWLSATALQTVGAKKWDGFLIALVEA